MSQLYWVVPLLVALVLFASVVVVPYRRLRQQAIADFKRARGTQHRALVEDALATVTATSARLRTEIARSVTARAALDEEERAELDNTLARHLVRTRLVEAPGIGSANARAIESTVFKHSLADLHHAAGYVPGIGPAKQAAISTWVQAMTSSWAGLRLGAYPGKQDIRLRFESRRAALITNEHGLMQRAGYLDQLARTATAALTTLGTSSVDDFVAALRGRRATTAQTNLGPYILGLFAPWSSAPSWFNDLLSNAQQEDRVGRAT